MSEIRIESFPAQEGDCFLVSIGKEKNKTHILIDGGYSETYHDYLKARLEELNKAGEYLSLVVVTHIDSDHIEGIIELLKENKLAKSPQIVRIDEIWHNSYRHLNFEKKESELNMDEKLILTEMVNKGKLSRQDKKNNQHNQSKDISAKDGSTLAGLIYKGKYNWNSSVNALPIKCNTPDIISLTPDIKVRILSPSLESLNKLKKIWVKELKKDKYDFKITDDELFDDAYEFFLLDKDSYEDTEEDKGVSHKDQNLRLESFLKRKTKNDTSVANGSSISFIVEYKNKKLLFLADSHPQDIYKEVERLIKDCNYIPFFDFIKVSHHGSNRNTSTELLTLIESPIYFFSTNGQKHNHPHPETIARIISRKGQKRCLMFNYPLESELLFDEDLKKEYNFKVEFGNEETFKVIDL
ncbi:MBL fold metallo-hydrolase [Bacillus safensis]|uniref:AVAST type 1 anti-phage system MBL fold metallo-hydrolase Avs1a n=1 Tax=Bacillus safensis TaxID=561879 RepID=UPI002481DF07|nr:AVAST type 1 anti-phage system MBL fold metallo-hydrolase Avs1a [Bacillus safensis]MDI0273537.1 MBL fold metallo-hydrolase [Bacillus safensis]